MDEKIKFEELGIEFSDEDFEGVSKKTLEECKAKIDEKIKQMEKKEEK